MENKFSPADVFDLTFTKFVTPVVVKIAFIVVLVFAGIMWLFMIIAGFGIADRFSARLVFLLSALIGSACNLAIT